MTPAMSAAPAKPPAPKEAAVAAASARDSGRTVRRAIRTSLPLRFRGSEQGSARRRRGPPVMVSHSRPNWSIPVANGLQAAKRAICPNRTAVSDRALRGRALSFVLRLGYGRVHDEATGVRTGDVVGCGGVSAP